MTTGRMDVAAGGRMHFEALAQAVFADLPAGLFGTLWLEDEDSAFVRLNAGRPRQAGRVRRPVATLRMIRDDRQASATLTLTGTDAAEDARRLHEIRAGLLTALPDAFPDPYLLVETRPLRSATPPVRPARDALDVAECVARAARGLDLVGFAASGPLRRGFASSAGALHWFESAPAALEFSLFAADGRAVKTTLAGDALDEAGIDAAIARAERGLEWLALPPVDVAPGLHRALLEPAATAELLSMLQWGGFSLRDARTGQSPLARFHAGQARFDPRITLVDDPAGLGAPRFQADGFLMPERTDLVRAGEPGALLASPRSAREFGVPSTGAPSSEMPTALRLEPGTLHADDALRALDAGLWIGNLWYLNWSDRNGARVTGMTRFATFAVEGGRVKGPVAPLRFDDTLFALLGDRLAALGTESVPMPDTSTYDGRATGIMVMPAMLLSALAITL